MAACFTEYGLGTIEEAYFCLVPALQMTGNLPPPHKAHHEAGAETRRLEDSGLWEQSFWWLYHSSRKTGASQFDIVFINLETKARLRRLAEGVSAKATKQDFDKNLSQMRDTVYSG